MKANAVKNSRQTEAYEKRRVLHKSDPDDSSWDTIINFIEGTHMNWKHTEINCNESDDVWIDFVLKEPVENTQNFHFF